MKVGDIVPSQTMECFGPFHKADFVPGRCVYIHPRRRFYTLEYVLPGGTFRESYPINYRRGETK